MVTLTDSVYHNTSRMTKPNKVMREKVLLFLKEQDVKTILDFGCGKFLRDAVFLAEQGFVVDAVDLEEQVQRVSFEKSKLIHSLSIKIPNNNYDAAMLNFIIQVLPTEEQRQEVLGRIYDTIKDEGYLVLSLRTLNDINRIKVRGEEYHLMMVL